ncbi:hypothetical protein JRO89_XS02G0232000 [Xanthoceras sorbifolium]|uniref:Uncharacterized protein n=1 Tax=Xanthoceras sorbifolium TaxID=99658 RepID=A0ABQ8IGQ5_9ROSI|nr:hypothetical protein JRO89_XS02G0232000 [Xanthoceras sorbifolium]
MDKQKRFKRLSITRILKRKQKPSALKKSASLQQVWYQFMGYGSGLPSVDEDALVLKDEQLDDHSQIGISVHQQNDTQLSEGTEETKNRFTEIEDETENCFVEIEEDTSEGDDQERQTRNTALNLKSTSTRQINITQLNARFHGAVDSSRIDIQEDHNRNNGGDHQRPQSTRNDKTLEWMFVITNFCLEVVSTVLDQLSSVHKPLYALLGMLFSFGAMLVCIVELVFKGRKEKVTWRWKGMKLPWFYYPTQSHDRLAFGTFKDIIGFACALCQCIVTTINYACVDKPIKISVWPIIFALGQLCSKILENPEKTVIV